MWNETRRTGSILSLQALSLLLCFDWGKKVLPLKDLYGGCGL